jgi:uncharacterized protein
MLAHGFTFLRSTTVHQGPTRRAMSERSRPPLALVGVFLSLVFTASGLLHYYLWSRAAVAPALPAVLQASAGLALGVVALVLPFALHGRRGHALISWAAFLWISVLFYSDVLFAAVDLTWYAGSVALRALGDPSPTWTTMHARIAAGATLLAAVTLTVMGVVRARGARVVRRVKVPIAGLPDVFAGLRIAQLSDVHVGPTIGKAELDAIVNEVLALEPDVIAITGDLVDGSVRELAASMTPLTRLHAPLGVFFVTGNHEYFSDGEAWKAHIASLGVRVLSNEHVVLERGGECLVLGGVEDVIAVRFGSRSDVNAAFAGAPEGPRVLLAHQPRSIAQASANSVALQLSGHTHGGQMRPFDILVRLEQPYIRGLHRHGSTWLWVSEGTGYWGPPVRVGTHCEISLVELAMEGARARLG